MKKTLSPRRRGSILLFLIILALPLLVQAQAGNPGPCGLPGIFIPCSPAGGPAGVNSATRLITSIVEILLFITGILAVLFLVIGGIRYIVAHGNEEASEAAKKTIYHAVIGLVIVILSFVIVRVIANALILGRWGV